ncbi:hypothetical protein [Anaeromyxobacter sp. Fw109-5]|uniref:hypothetical protein n=1 Tax=Anaeromyxobacter sp. (strain Fw109-5) TaxID=404589 RepID=UPI0002FC0AF3|nr:hypothetical protein [Anaeromyxobacter sp. Fw109-5]
MSPADRLLACLAAAMAPQRAPALLSRLGSAGAGAALAHGGRLALTGRGDRLAALAAALASAHAAAPARPSPTAERASVTGVLLALRGGLAPPAAVSPVLARLCRERLG